jgi:uncharacterized repeat protein (TIGR03803 family)
MFPRNSRLSYRVAAPLDCPETLRRTKLKLFNPRSLRIALASLAVLALLNLAGLGQSFAKGGVTTDARNPMAPLIMDANGNLYGTALGGSHSNSPEGNGTVFKLTPNGTGGWTESVLFDFNYTDGQFPESGLVIDSSGNLYGTTMFGGTNGDGVVYELSPPTKRGSGWTESVLLNFNGTNGAAPDDALTMDASGNLYGTAQSGGINKNNAGVVFKLTKSGGTWTPSVLYNFVGGPTDGSTPLFGVKFDSAGNLYGTTSKGGTYSAGTVYKLTPSGSSWSESFVYAFEGPTADGSSPGALIVGASPLASTNLYGVSGGGTFGDGMLYSLPLAGGAMDTPLYDFTGLADGSSPKGILEDAGGNLYGVTNTGGSGDGTVFELTGSKLMPLWSFSGADGNGPWGGVIMDVNGNLYGTTQAGGANGWGTVFKLTPNGSGVWTESVLYSFK